MPTRTIGVCLKAQNNPFWSDVARGMQESAAARPGIRLEVHSPERMSQLRRQAGIVRRFVREQVDAIILAPSDPALLSPAIAEARRRRIPVIIIDSEIEGAGAPFVGFDDFKGGFETGLFLRSRLGKGDKVAVIAGPARGSYTRREEGFLKAVRGHLDVCAVRRAGFEEDLSYSATVSIVRSHPSVRAFFCTSDNMALGCASALHDLARSDIHVCGFDATHAGLLALKAGRLLSTVSTSPETMGAQAVATARLLLEQRRTPRRQLAPVELLTKGSFAKLPKQAIQKREYRIVDAQRHMKEFDYSSLPDSLVCPIVIGRDSYLAELPERLRALDADKYFVLTDHTIRRLYGNALQRSMERSGMRTSLHSTSPGERHKTFTTLNNLANSILDEGITKRSCIVILGGGVIGNMAGFLAAILMRGIRFVHVPTTVTAQIDSTTGGKQAVNTAHGKNMLGTFYEPEFIYIHPAFIKTLPARQYRAGMAEAIKHGLCQSRKLLGLIDEKKYETAMRETILLKTRLLATDPREKALGLILVYGHSVGHALEILSDHRLAHGEAISIGMMVDARIAVLSGIARPSLVAQHKEILARHGLPTRIPRDIPPAEILRLLMYDKKERRTHLPFMLLERIGRARREPVMADEHIILQAVRASY